MRFWLIGLFVVLPVIELAVIIQVGTVLGVWPTIGLMILSAVVGSWLMRQQGAAALADLQRSFTELRDPTAPLAHGAMIVLAGALMVAPGFVTDLTGIALLIPAVRRAVIGFVGKRVRFVQMQPGFGPRNNPSNRADGPIIDGEFSDLDTAQPLPRSTQNPPKNPSGWTKP